MTTVNNNFGTRKCEHFDLPHLGQIAHKSDTGKAFLTMVTRH